MKIDRVKLLDLLINYDFDKVINYIIECGKPEQKVKIFMEECEILDCSWESLANIIMLEFSDD